MARRWGGLAALGVLFGCGGHATERPSAGGTASGACAEATRTWAQQCASREAIEIPRVQCPEPGLVLVDVGAEAVLRVELRRATPQSFRQVGAWGLSPVGDFPDWNQVDAQVRRRFETLAGCVRADERFAQGLGEAAPSHEPRQQRPQRREESSPPTAFNSVPWLLLAALACLLATLRRAARSPAWRRRAVVGGGLALGTLALRSAVLPARFFHQNGQGPLWISELVSPQHHPYGPGFRELFGWLRWVAPDPDRGVFLAQGALACLAVPCAAFVARRLGAHRALAFALAFALAIDPIVGRLSRSESYYGVGASLLFIAAAALASSLGALRRRSAGFALPALAAGLVIAQHARVHPIGWLAAALCPAVLLLAPGHWRRRLRRTLAATLLIAAVVALTSAPAMLAVLRSPFGAQWTGSPIGSGQSLARLSLLWKALPLTALVFAGAIAGARSWRRGALQGLVLTVASVALLVANIVGSGSSKPWIQQAYLRLYAPVALVLLAAAAQRLTVGRWRRMASAALVAAAAVAVAASGWRSWTTIPTDAQEQELVRRWRAELPRTARLAYVERVGRRVLMLPVYADAPTLSPSPLLLRQGEMVEDLSRVGQETFYARSSLCTTPEGRGFCAQFEERYRLTRLHEAELPAIPSMVGLDYDRPTVRVGVYRVDGAR